MMATSELAESASIVRLAPSSRDLAELALDQRHPLSQWWLVRSVNLAAILLTPSAVRPWHVTASGGLCGLGAGAVLLLGWPAWQAAALVLLCWFFDLLDGKLARMQGNASAFGAWADANLDEVVDLGVHAAVAYAAAVATGSQAPWLLYMAFMAGKYLLYYSVNMEEGLARPKPGAAPAVAPRPRMGRLRRLYHLPGNIDVRIHLLAAGLVSGCLTTELACIAVYYNLRWIVRWGLVWKKLSAPGGVA